MDFLSPIVGPVVESLLVPVKRHLGYLLSSTKHVSNMSNKMKQLQGASDDVKNHMETNTRRILEIPARVPAWLEEVEKIKEDAERISSNVNGCFNLKMRYEAGRNAFKITQEIEGLIKENIETSWSDAQKPLGKVSFKKASTSAPSDGDTQNDFKSRDKIFKDALGFLQQDHKVQVIALCGMGGVGKTTMMEQLKKAVEDKKMFDWVVKVVCGRKMNTLSIQETIADYLGHPLIEKSKTARADRLRKTFGKISQESKEKVLVILDDVWEKVELKDIGLSPLPNGCKLLLTSRNANICTQIDEEANLEFEVVKVDVMEKSEANNFFCKIIGVSIENDPELKDIGVKIVKRCGFLPLAIKLIATTLKSQEKFVWRNTLHRLKENDLDENVQEILEISYTFIKEEDVKAIFQLCGLFPDDFNIPIEDLTRYAWGLKLLNAVPTLGHARDRTRTCVLNLKNANLLMDSDYLECVKMHDLVLAFVVGKVSKGDHPWIINHEDVSNWSRAEMSESCSIISLTCMGMSEFPKDFNHPKVSLLRLMNGDKSLKFPEDFYEKMENLQVIAYEKLQYPLLPRSLQCSTNLKTLCLHQCSLMDDCSPIGDHLLNLEVLSFAHSGIRYLPSAIGNLKKLKVLDLTGCIDLRIDDGVLENLVKLEELYMRVANKKGVRFTDINYKELEERSKNLSALEVEFFEKNPRSMNMSYNKLERFKISIGRFLEENSGEDTHSSENTLMLVANKDELLESGMNELFQKTEVLYLESGGMNNLEEVLPKSVTRHSFYNLRVLHVFECADLRYLFTVPVASGLVKLERLTISWCPVMEVLVYGENGEKGGIRFQELKHLYLYRLPMLVGFSNTKDVIDLPQLVDLELDALPNITSIYPEYKSAVTSVMSSSSSSSSAIKPFFNKEVMIPRLGSLRIYQMKALKNIWPCGGSGEVDTCLLREIRVEFCDNLVNMFPRNPMPLLHHLETIHVRYCGSIEVLFNIDVGCLGEIEEGGSKLRSIHVRRLGKLTEVWRLEGVISPNVIICCFQAVERIRIVGCKSFRSISTPTTAKFDLGALRDIYIDGGGYIESVEENDFKSREKNFKDALGFLQQDQKGAQVIALCGMGGVGKTTMMEQLKKAVEDKEMFDYVVKVVIGQKVNTLSIQNNVAEYLGHSLTETSKTARADRLRMIFEKMSQADKKVLVMLDDVWEKVELKDIGLCPLPNGSKFLLTSRNENVCRQMAIESNSDLSVVRVDVMEELEANNFFSQITGVSKENDPERNDIGVEIVRRCGFLPLAIKLIATALNSQEKFVWRNTLHRLKGYNLDENVQEIIEISYTFIREEDVKAIFLLCGLFPDGHNIPIEDLSRYAWGLKLLNAVSTLGDTRDRTKTCVLKLKNANLLMDSDYLECVKMHDLLLDFVVAKVSRGDHPWIINHGDVSNCSRAEMSESCRRISLTCMGMSEFPRDLNHPNVSLLRLMNGDKSLKFPEDFYERMENLQVIACEKLQYPLLPRSLQCSTKLKTLCLHECLLMFDCSPIGDHLLNLEVLSFAHSSIRYLPSAIRNLKKLKLLDLTGCIDLQIDEGVLKNLAKLEELYMRVANKNGVRFTDINYKELEERSKNLSTLEVEFFEKNPQSMHMSYNKLKRFKISVGGFLEANSGKDMHSSENTLKLVGKKDEVLESGMNELFQKTEVLHLEAWGGMNNLAEVLPKSVPQHSFVMLRVLYVSKCGDLRYLFTVPVVGGLVKLESLTVGDCPVMKVLVNSENGEEGVDIRFQELKHLCLEDLPMLVGFSNTNDVIDLPQLVELDLFGLPKFTSIYPEYRSAPSSVMSSSSRSSAIIKPFFNKEVTIPKLETLSVRRMEALKNIWACQSIISSEEVDACLLREIRVESCDNLVNMFPRNPMSLLHHLETICVSRCGSIEVLFEIDDVGEIKAEGGSKLRSIHVRYSEKLREVWSLNGVINPEVIICGFQAVEKIFIQGCKRFRNIFTPTTARFDLGALRDIYTDGGDHNEWVEKRKQEIDDISKGEIIQVADNIPYVAYPFHLLPTFHHLQSLRLSGLTDVEAVFEIESATASRDLATTWDNQQPSVLPNLENLELHDMKKMNCVWKCTWNHFLYSKKQRESSFQNLTSISLESCGKIKYLFSPLMVKLLFNLKTIDISECDGIEEVVSSRDDDDIQTMAASTSSRTNPTFFRHLDSLNLFGLSKLRRIDDGGAITSNISIHDNFKSSQEDVISCSLCQHSRKIKISECNALSNVIQFSAVGKLQKLETLIVTRCQSMREIFEIEVVNNSCPSTNVGDGCGDIHNAVTIPRVANMILLELSNLQILQINQCDLLEYIFISSTLESLKQLKELTVEHCKAMQVIVKEDDLKEDGKHTTSKVVVFPHLKSLTLTDLPNVKGFFLGMNEFRWPQLDKVKIFGCPQMMVFTPGHSMTPKLNYMHTGLGKHSLECGLNFRLTNVSHETKFCCSSVCSTPDMIKLLQFPWSFSNLVQVDTNLYNTLLESRIIFPHNELHKLQNLEKLNVTLSRILEEVFEVVEETNDYMNETQSAVVFPKLKEVILEKLESVKLIWKNNRQIVLNFPNLTKVLINHCPLLGNVFTSCMVDRLLQLQELHISQCKNMKVVVKQVEDSDTRASEVLVFPRLKSLTLVGLQNLKGIYLGLEAFMWPLLDTLEIKDCPQITVFTSGRSTTPELKVIDTSFGLCYATEDPTSFIKTKQQEGLQF